jgi:hypothetical protein
MNNEWSHELEFYYEYNLNKKNYDYHPHTLDYANYLTRLGIVLPRHVLKYAYRSLAILKKVEYFRDLPKHLPEVEVAARRSNLF